MTRTRFGFAFLAGVVLLGGALMVLPAASAGAAPVLPGITGKDQYPNGCVDCHVKDTLLPAMVAKVSGHPKIDKIVKTVPKDCMICHKAGGKAPEMNLVSHKVHYSNPAKNGYVNDYQGSCLNCHALNVDTGAMAVKSGAKNW